MRNFPRKSSPPMVPFFSAAVSFIRSPTKYQTSLLIPLGLASCRASASTSHLAFCGRWRGGNTTHREATQCEAGGPRTSGTSGPPSPTSAHLRLLGSLPLLPISSFIGWKMRLHSTSFIFFTTFMWSVQPQPGGNQAGKGCSFLGDIQRREPQIHHQEFFFFYHHHTVCVALSILTVTHLS